MVGGSEERTGCSTGLSERDLRTAMVRKEIVSGMTHEQIESIFDRPDRQGHVQGGGTVTYWNDKFLNYFSVNYDRNGCVESSYQSGSRR
ncbi:MAG: hypothetical protein GAK43_01893 [Stenotrophomonas maltophilia]|nr:MAG: hypothetical protein GAK43_01893 [Stenotrophomonas maltophilia]